MALKSCVSPEGKFIFGIHKPSFEVANHRDNDLEEQLGSTKENIPVLNTVNFPQGNISEDEAAWIFEIPNPFPFRGTTFIKKDWADRKAANPVSIRLPEPPDISLTKCLGELLDGNDQEKIAELVKKMPDLVRLALATTSTDPADLITLARRSCRIIDDASGEPVGLEYLGEGGDIPQAVINDHALFEALVNNPYLPDKYKVAMVLRPGVQGGSEIVGEYGAPGEEAHVFEYLRRNSYISWGHYASNMANDSIRYSVKELSEKDMKGLRHLYYQRTFLRIAEMLDLPAPPTRKTLTTRELEDLRTVIVSKLETEKDQSLSFNSTLWGWNYGFDFAPSRYRLHASHQQIHQQFAMIPNRIENQEGGVFEPYGCGDLVHDWLDRFAKETGEDFFKAYLEAIRSNTRTDGNTEGPSSLAVYEDRNVLLFVPKAQTSQWELQLVCLNESGNILEADLATRDSLDLAILLATRILDRMGARMITSIEFPKKLNSRNNGQRLLYSFLPKLPESPGAFSEAQLRWINGHYPEDFAAACRMAKDKVMN
jgi:hypothetical protein